MTNKPNNDPKPPGIERELSAQLLQDYGKDIDHLELSEETQGEFLLALWNIMVIFADLGFGLGPVPEEVGDKPNEKLADLRVDVLSLLDLRDTPHETVAPQSTRDDEAQP